MMITLAPHCAINKGKGKIVSKRENTCSDKVKKKVIIKTTKNKLLLKTLIFYKILRKIMKD